MSNNLFDLDELKELVADSDFDEIPVHIEEFVQSDKFLGLPPLSENQYMMIKSASQIYKKETLIELYGEEIGLKRWGQTFTESIFKLGKGSGKDYCSGIACAYVSYLLLCLKDPARYYDKPPGNTIDIINVAINAQQANNVFFKNLKTIIEHSPWFEGKYTLRAGQIEFEKNINIYSGHSEREAYEGYNVIFVVLDEISGFALESNTGNQQANTAEAVYDMYRASVDSRFPQLGKVLLLSFPRFKGCFISQKYDSVIAEKEVINRTYKFKINEELPDGLEENEFEIEWTEDHIISYKFPGVYALCRPSWEVNPTKKIDDYKMAFMRNVVQALSRFACMPPDAIDAFFKDREKINAAFCTFNGIDDEGVFTDSFKPKDEETKYFIHVDLAKKQDKCALALAHVDKWRMRTIGSNDPEILPVVTVDLIKWWTPTADKNVDFADVRDFIVSLQQRGFNLSLVTFDRWRSDDLINYLNRIGIKSEVLSVAKRHYGDFSIVMHDDRLAGPDIKLLRDELTELRIMPNDKVDHPRKGSKDLADAVCGSIYNAVAHTPRDMMQEIEVSTWESVNDVDRNTIEQPKSNNNVIKAPEKQMPSDIEEFLANIEAL